MTEDEAKTKACFKAATFGASQQLADGPGPHCIGSACMAWRTTERFSHTEEGIGARPSGNGWVASPDGGWVRSVYRPINYCGLAGAPL